MKLLLDEQISGQVAERLRDRDQDVTAATDDPGLRGLSDPDLFDVAQQRGRALVTYNRVDFEPLIREYAARNAEHHGLVLVHPTRFPSREFARLTSALESLLQGPELGKSSLVWLQEPEIGPVPARKAGQARHQGHGHDQERGGADGDLEEDAPRRSQAAAEKEALDAAGARPFGFESAH